MIKYRTTKPFWSGVTRSDRQFEGHRVFPDNIMVVSASQGWDLNCPYFQITIRFLWHNWYVIKGMQDDRPMLDDLDAWERRVKAQALKLYRQVVEGK